MVFLDSNYQSIHPKKTKIIPKSVQNVLANVQFYFHVKGYKINLASAILVSPAIEAAAAAAAR